MIPRLSRFHVGLMSWICLYEMKQWYHTWPRIPHDDVNKWQDFPRYWPFVLGIHRSPVNSPHKGQWRGAFMISLVCAGINGLETMVRLVIWDAIAPIMTSLQWYATEIRHIARSLLCFVVVRYQPFSPLQYIRTRFLLCCALLWLYIDWFSHIHQAYFTGTVAI